MNIKSLVLKYYNDKTEKRVDIFSTLVLQILNNPGTLLKFCAPFQFLFPLFFQTDGSEKIKYNEIPN